MQSSSQFKTSPLGETCMPRVCLTVKEWIEQKKKIRLSGSTIEDVLSYGPIMKYSKSNITERRSFKNK